MNYLHTVWQHLSKDLRLEWRSRDALIGMLFFTLLIAVVFSMAFDPTGQPTLAHAIAGGLLWVGLLFAATTALQSSWDRERRNHVLDALRMTPAAPSALFIGKALANFLFVASVEIILGPIFILFFNLHVLGQAWWLAAVLPLGTWALIVNGTFFAALGMRARNRALLLPMVLFPVSIPALLAMVQSTTSILTGETDPQLWIKLLAGYDIVFTTVCVLLFEPVLNAE